uniref:C3/C5 convertase n=1 Tax=Cyprinus carpio TaxID=7962 RepID=A0A8C2KS53_CYPCA
FENGEVIPYKAVTQHTVHGSSHFYLSVYYCLTADHCPDPGVPPGSSRTGNMFNIDDKVTYRCQSPMTLIGSKVRVCLDGGQWSGTEPQCYADFTYDSPEEASEAFSSSLKSKLAVSQQYEKLDMYIAVDASGSIDPKNFENAKTTIKMLINKISYYPVSPNYEILMFATDVTRITSMRDFKNNEDARNLMNIFKDLDDFNYERVGVKTGTNIAKAYTAILESMKLEELNNATTFSETQHIVILFSDGQANMGGNPRPKVEQIKHLVTKNDPNREKNLDLYVFGVGDDVNQEDINGLVSQRDQEKYFFKLKDLTEVQEMFDDMIDESTSVGLCGIVWEGLENKRRAFPWLAQINIQHPSTSKGSNCMGSLVSSSYILTAAHCFKEGDTPNKITVKLEKDLVVKVKNFTLHPKYKPKAKQHIGIQECYEFDVALIQLEKAVEMSFNLRPICIPCTRETNGALKLSESEGTCRKHEEILMNNELVEAAFTSDMDIQYIYGNIKKNHDQRDACVEDAKKAKGINVKNAREVVTDNFLCSGGNEPKTDDVLIFDGDSGAATYVNKKGRVIQVGVVSWGVKDVCKEKRSFISDADSRDYHSNLFSEEIRSFLKEHLEKDHIGQPLTFL